ncbi:MAG: hypothetical protein K2Z81_11420, partial [Cyanobacteria bacterium]|nr:hypothetical protein [Cyanobacteriota bacterium]
GFLWGDHSGLALPLMPFLMATLIAIFGSLTLLKQLDSATRRNMVQSFALVYVPLSIFVLLLLVCPQTYVAAFKHPIFRVLYTAFLAWTSVGGYLLFRSTHTFIRMGLVCAVLIPLIAVLLLAVSFTMYQLGPIMEPLK